MKSGGFRQVFLIHGLKRSGNHAIINWIAAQGAFHKMNNVIPIAPILSGISVLPDPLPYIAWLKLNYFQSQLQTLKNKLLRTHKSLLVSLEDHSLEVTPFIQVPVPLTYVLILRDPENLFASRIRKASNTNNPTYSEKLDDRTRELMRLWKSHAKEFLGVTNVLSNKVCISFNAWFASREYRQQIAEQLNLCFNDSAFPHISSIGGGSSFDGTVLSGNPSGMNVLNRRLDLNEDEETELQQILEDKELIYLSGKFLALTHAYES